MPIHKYTMNTKEKPDFFNSSQEYFVVEVTDSMIQKAKELKNKGNEVDKTDERDADRSQQDSLVGKIGEVVVEEFFKSNNISVSFNDGWVYDMNINGYSAEIKTRDYTQTAPYYSDLLVRDRVDTNWSPSDVDIIIQVMVNGENTDKAYITGYAYGEFVAQCDFFRKAKTHRTRKTAHEELQPIEDILN